MITADFDMYIHLMHSFEWAFIFMYNSVIIYIKFFMHQEPGHSLGGGGGIRKQYLLEL